MRLSIIVPVYNTEKYLRECLDSLINQDLLDYEIIVVNDGSTDQSTQIINEFEKNYPNLIKGINKPNGGLSDARNYGMSHAKGKYVLFVDSDDYLKKNCLNKLCEKMDLENLDILVFDFMKVYDGQIFIHEISMKHISEQEYILSTPNACNKMFRLDVFKKNNIQFPVGIWYEDLAVIPGLIRFTKKIGYINEAIYYYQFRNQSIMNQTSYNPKILDMIKSIQNLSENLRDGYYEELEYLSILHLFYGSSLKLLPFKKKGELELCLLNHKKNYKNWKKNKYFLQRPPIFKLYCYLLDNKCFWACDLLVKIRKKISK